MVSFEEYYNNKINEAATNTFDSIIKIKGNAFKQSKLAKTKAKEIINTSLKNKELIKSFFNDADKAKIKTDTDEYKNLALAISVLAANKDKSSVELLDKLNIKAPEEGKIKDLQLIKNIDAGTKPLIKSIRFSEAMKDKNKPEEAKTTPETGEEETGKKETGEEETGKKEAGEEEKTVYKKPFVGQDAQKLPSSEDERSPSAYSSQAKELLSQAIENINKSSENAPDTKKMKMKKAATDLERAVNKKINGIEKQQQNYSNHSNFSTRLKATTKSKNFLSEIEYLINTYKNKATQKSLDTKAEQVVGAVKNAGKAIKSGAEKVANTRTAKVVKDVAARTSKVAVDAAKRGAELAKPIIKRTTDKVVDKIKTTTNDAIIRKWLPSKLEDFVKSNDEKVKADILQQAKNLRDKAEREESNKRRIAKNAAKKKPTSPTPPSVMKRKEEPTLTDIPVKSAYPDQANAKLA